ncbi:lytic murein transglycosylase B [Marinicella gelatinilytica]|uniref:lytic murein transglycosylase B n=1 Tax=Marinicella gelatinilytica TaxID=2996017 RepID=UPI002260A287|nr:lytic murein transglycosylase B [Marinicella gelatinilytica]MCX7545561.1 lytic murein transglycosylase B [Marinicella gelatinilytica]
MKTNLLIFILLLPLTVTADVKPADIDAFISKTAQEYDLKPEAIRSIIDQAQHQQSIIDAMNKPAEKVLEWYQYRPIFITDKRINEGVDFWQEHADVLQQVSEKTEVPAHIIVAIIGVETFYGRIKGNHKVLDALYTLAFDYPKRSTFFTKELGHFMKLSADGHVSALEAKGSYAGAMGYGQFMPSSYRSYAVDYENDGVIDLLNNPHDAIASVANYIAKHGWQKDQPVVEKTSQPDKTIKLNQLKPHLIDDNGQSYTLIGMKTDEDTNEYWRGFHNFYVISRYNHSHMYVMAVYQLAEKIKAAHDAALSKQPQPEAKL